MRGPTRQKIQQKVRKRDFPLIRLTLLLTVDGTSALGTKCHVFMQQDRSSTCPDTCSFPRTAEKVLCAHRISNTPAPQKAGNNEEQIPWAKEESIHPQPRGFARAAEGAGPGMRDPKCCV